MKIGMRKKPLPKTHFCVRCLKVDNALLQLRTTLQCEIEEALIAKERLATTSAFFNLYDSACSLRRYFRGEIDRLIENLRA
jgi:hypothetical protein